MKDLEKYAEWLMLQLPSGYHDTIKKGREKFAPKKPIVFTHYPYIVLEYLNKKIGSRFKNASVINTRMKEGASIDDCKKVIDNKVADWLHTDMAKYLRPSTLFCKKHFDSYLNQVDKKEGTYIEDFK